MNNKQPNIVFILSDQHNASVMANAGDPYINTPNMDRLASTGVKFQNCYCGSPLCVPSRMSLLTGKLPENCRVYNNNQTLHSDFATFAHSANIAGYETILSGRMHFYGADQYHGFEQRLVGDNTPLYHGYDIIKENFGALWTSVLQKREGLTNAGHGDSAVFHFDNDVVDGTIEFLEKREDERPLLLTVGLFAPHPPFVGKKDRFEYYQSILPDAHVDADFKEKLHPAAAQWLIERGVYEVTTEEWRNMRAAYYSMVEFLDENVGRVLDSVEKTLGLENTIIVYGSDHGEGLGINGIPWKGTFYDCSAKVPLIVSYPKEYKQNVVIDELTSLLDLSATFTDITGGPALPDAEGMSLIEVLKGEGHIAKDRAVISQVGTYPGKADKPSAMIRKGNYKLISYYGFEVPQLFDLSIDPYEVNNLAELPEYESVVCELAKELGDTWNPELAYQFCVNSSKNFQILTKWSNTTNFPMPKRWEVDPKVNHLD